MKEMNKTSHTGNETKEDIRKIVSPYITALDTLRQPSHMMPRNVPVDGVVYLLLHSVGIPAGYAERQRRRRSGYRQYQVIS
jgi:hypothetical protein